MKAFSLEEHLKNPSRKVVTREGKTVKRILCTDASGSYPVVALIEESYYDNALSYTDDGKLYNGESNVYDLFFAPEKHEGWVNIYRASASGNMSAGHIFNTEEDAKHNADIDDIATVKIEWEE